MSVRAELCAGAEPRVAAGEASFLRVPRRPLTLAERGAKRAVDLLVATTGLALVSPLLALVMLLVRLESPGPALFRQTRRGVDGRPFTILKLRTMRVMEDGLSVTQARRRDPRVTRLGAWLRRTSADELPQFWNVILGEMSIVGPRPHAIAHDDHYGAAIDRYADRQHVKPGMTGLAQVRGLRGETPDIAAMRARIEHDLIYIGTWSLLLDLRIMALTLVRLFSRAAY